MHILYQWFKNFVSLSRHVFVYWPPLSGFVTKEIKHVLTELKYKWANCTMKNIAIKLLCEMIKY
jgi:hypothetical protein